MAGPYSRSAKEQLPKRYRYRRRVPEGYFGALWKDDYESEIQSGGGGGNSQSRSNIARGMVVSPWESGIVPTAGMSGSMRRPGMETSGHVSMGMGGGGGGGGGGGHGPDLIGSINQLSQMGNPESKLAMNILNSVLASGGGGGGGMSSSEGRDTWRGEPHPKMRRMDWEDRYDSQPRGRALPSPQHRQPYQPQRKFPKRDPSQFNPPRSWGNKRKLASEMGTIGGKEIQDDFLVPQGKAGLHPAIDQILWKSFPPKKEKNRGTNNPGNIKTSAGWIQRAGPIEGKTEDIAEGKGKASATSPKQSSASGPEKTKGQAAKGKKLRDPLPLTEKGPTEAEQRDDAWERALDISIPPAECLKCHICDLKLNSIKGFRNHLVSDNHAKMGRIYLAKCSAMLDLLRCQSRLQSQRNIVDMRKDKGKITMCHTCQCPIKGGSGPHFHLREHALVYHFNKCFLCKTRCDTRGELENHRLTFQHILRQYRVETRAIEKFQRKKQTLESDYIPELETTAALHKVVEEIQLSNVNAQVWSHNVPYYDPAVPTGINHLVKVPNYVCPVCPKKVSRNARDALEHFKSQYHYNNYVAYLKDQEEKKENTEPAEGKENNPNAATEANGDVAQEDAEKAMEEDAEMGEEVEEMEAEERGEDVEVIDELEEEEEYEVIDEGDAAEEDDDIVQVKGEVSADESLEKRKPEEADIKEELDELEAVLKEVSAAPTKEEPTSPAKPTPAAAPTKKEAVTPAKPTPTVALTKKVTAAPAKPTPKVVPSKKAAATPAKLTPTASPTKKEIITPAKPTPTVAPTKKVTTVPAKPTPTAVLTKKDTPTPAKPTPTAVLTKKETPTPAKPTPTAVLTKKETTTPAKPTPTASPTKKETPTPAKPAPTASPTKKETVTPAKPAPATAPAKKATTTTTKPTPATAPIKKATDTSAKPPPAAPVKKNDDSSSQDSQPAPEAATPSPAPKQTPPTPRGRRGRGRGRGRGAKQ